MKLEKQHAKLIKLQTKAESCMSRDEAQKIKSLNIIPSCFLNLTLQSLEQIDFNSSIKVSVSPLLIQLDLITGIFLCILSKLICSSLK